MTDQTLNFLASAGPLANVVVKGPEVDAIMIQTSGTLMARGVLYDIISKKVGPKTYKLTLKRSN